jgi:protein involved in polysaccharide export with SLBB domain
MTDPGTPTRNEGVAEAYVTGCPDVLEVFVQGRPELCGHKMIGADGRIDLRPLGRVRVEGRTALAIGESLAEHLHLPPSAVQVRVAEYNSQQLFLFGQISGAPCALPYQGQETVLDLLKRAGGVTSVAAPDEVYVVRSHIAEGQRPEVFRVDLHAILFKHDVRSNVRLQPSDHIHVGETRQGRLDHCLPPCLRFFYQAIWGIRPSAPAVAPDPVLPKPAHGS